MATIRACVASRYDVQFSYIDEDDVFTDIMIAANELGYDSLVINRTSGDDIMDWDKATLESMQDDSDIDASMRSTIQNILDQSDPDVDFVHIEFLEVS
jgi:hypothetical protein